MLIERRRTHTFTQIIIIMSEIKQNAVLEHVVAVLQNAISGSKVKQISNNESAVLDGNAAILIKQNFEGSGDMGDIIISDKKEILYSEDLLETVHNIQESANHDAGLKAALSNANIVVNNLNVEAELIFYAVRDHFYGLSGSYEFVNFIERDIHHLSFNMSFGDHTFQVIIRNEPGLVAIEGKFEASLAPAVRETINADINKVKKHINIEFKKELL